ncbi:MAG TPA: hypothetical protein VMR70_16670 [Flavisolibacter sp.]|nr:hypothetical protein [Flavisolibacter sp.]
MAEVQEGLLTIAPASIRELSPSPKISKGENYLGLPYVILDYPRISKAEDLFFIRSMFWWGNFFSSTLQVSGSYKQAFAAQIIAAYDDLKEHNYAVGINANPWVHHFEAENYRPIQQLSSKGFTEVITQQPHIKIAASWPLSKWDEAAITLLNSWKFFVDLVA